MAGLIDTNLLLYAVNRDAEEYRRAVEFLETAGNSSAQWYLTEGILYEFFRVATHPKVFNQPLTWQQAVEFIRPFVANARFRLLQSGDQHFGLLEEVLRSLTHPAGNLFFDVRTVVLMREHGVREIYTADVDFLQFPGITVINPLRNPAEQ